MAQPSSTLATVPFVWFELLTPDAAQAEAFYGKVLGWNARHDSTAPHPYTIFSVGETGVAGAYQMAASAFVGGVRPGWLGYIGVENMDAAAAALTTAGGMVHRPAQDIPGVGRFAVVADPQGAAYMLIQPQTGSARPALSENLPGTFAWAELVTVKWEASFEFYSKLYGWTKGTAMDMGTMGTYQLLQFHGRDFGAMMNRRDPTQPPMWGYYFHVENIEAAVARVEAAGGKIIHPPMTVPGGQRVAAGTDLQGGFFGMVAPADS